jgi:methyl-accepting chemotaxis protein
MRQVLTRTAGVTLIAAGVAGVLFSVIALVVVSRLLSNVQAAADRRIIQLDRALAATGDGLVVAHDSLGRAEATMRSLHTTIDDASQAITDTLPALDRVGALVGEDLPTTITSTRSALASAQETARVADSLLGTISQFQLIGAELYDPKVPLNVAIEQVADSLNSLPESLASVQGDLRQTAGNLGKVNAQLGSVAGNMGDIGTSMADADSVITKYQGIVGELRGQVEDVRRKLPGWLSAIRLGISLMLVWLGIAQIGLLTQGWELVQRSRAVPAVTRPDEPERLPVQARPASGISQLC